MVSKVKLDEHFTTNQFMIDCASAPFPLDRNNKD